MTDFTLQPGDYIPTSEVPADKRQAVIDAFVAAGARMPFEYFEDHLDNTAMMFDLLGDFDIYQMGIWVNERSRRRVTLEQILGDQSPSWDEVGPELLDASRKLNVEVSGLNAFKEELVHVIGATNWSVLEKRMSDLDEAITKARSIT